MAAHDDAFRDRARAESFGSVAAAYDRFRPSYPAELVADLLETGPRTALDVGCGTGKAGRLLAERGVEVLGVEVDADMAALAAGHGLAVEVASFEDWDDRGRTFDLVMSAQAWHWVDPARAAPKAARLLRPGGRLVPFWNWDELRPEVQRAVQGVYERLEPDLAEVVGANRRHEDRPYLRQLEQSGAFGSTEVRNYVWHREDTVADWLGALGTQSSHVLLPPQRLADLQTALGETLAFFGPSVRVLGGTFAIFAGR